MVREIIEILLMQENTRQPEFLPEEYADKLILCNCCQLNNMGLCPTMAETGLPPSIETTNDLVNANCFKSKEVQQALIAQVRAQVAKVGFSFNSFN